MSKTTIHQAAEAPRADIAPGYFLDLVIFWVGVNAYQQMRGPDDEHSEKALKLIRRYQGEMVAGLQQFVEPLTEVPAFTRFRAPVALASRPTPGMDHAVVQAVVLADLFSVLRSKPTNLKTIFSEPRSASAATRMANLASSDSPETILNGLATIPPASRLQTTRTWLKEAAKLSGVAPSDVEGIITDAETARNLGEDVREVEAQLSSLDPMSEDAVTLQGQKQDLLGRIENVVETSANPTVVLSAAAIAASQPKVYATKVGKEKGLSPDQERAMMIRGPGIIAAGAGSGKCITADSLVQTELGLIPIGDLAGDLQEEQDTPLSLIIHGRSGPEKTNAIYYDGVRATRRIETCQGYEIEGTGPHRILILRAGLVEWARLDELVEGDVVCIDRRAGLFAEKAFQRTPDDHRLFRTNATPDTNIPLELTPQVASLLGWVVSEGYIRQNQWHISLATTDPAQRDLYTRAMAGLVTPVESEDNRHTRQFVLDFFRSADVRALMGFGLTRTLAGEKEVPVGVLRSPKPVVRAFLRSLFDGDGGVTANTVEFCTASTTLARQVHVLLAAFGIPARKKFRPNRGQGAWHLVIGGLGLRVFAAEIGFDLQSKTQRLQGIMQRDANTNIDVIPDVSDLCRAVKEQYKERLGTSRTEDAGYGTFKCLTNGSRRPSFASLQGFLDFYRLEDSTEWTALDALCQSKWFFDPIVEITESTAPVYDFIVPGTHSFSANGFINHNTRVLASKVVYHMDELGVPAQSVMATSFSKKSAAELRTRIEKFGGNFPKGTDTGLGTTHSIAGKLMKEYGSSRRGDAMKNYDQSSLIRLAMAQVTMGGGGTPVPSPESLFPAVAAVTVTPESNLSFAEAMNAAYQNRGRVSGFLRKFLEGFFHSGDTPDQKKWYRMNREKTRDLTNPFGLTGAQQDVLVDVFRHTGVEYNPDTDPVLNGGGGGRRAAKKPRDKDKGLRGKYDSFTKPAGQWFNLGLLLTEDGTEESDPIPVGQFKQAISKYKGKCISPSEAWAKDQAPHAAVYAAYEYLKGPDGEQKFRGHGDMDDILLDVSKMMLSNPKALKQIQARFKVVLVDEAQDLNRAQHMMFGLIAGYVDATKAQKIASATKFSEMAKDDGTMTADTYTLIGDDKQAIYEFRGADPETFIDMSNLVEGGAGFKTEVLKTNYRSGELIVQAANRLIAHNCIEASTPIHTSRGDIRAMSLQVGDEISTYRNGEVVTRRVCEVNPSAWTQGFTVTTASGHKITMSPNHRLWASEPSLPEGHALTYLMYRADMGFRVGMTSYGGRPSRGDGYAQSLGARASMEWGERMWVLGLFPSTEEALAEETKLSLRFGIPMTTFNTGSRGPDDERIRAIFTEFGNNGLRLLESRYLSPDLPHWAAQSQRRDGRVRGVVSLLAHGGGGSQVYLRGDNGEIHTRKQFGSYEEAQTFARALSTETGSFLVEKMSVEDAELRLLTASALLPGMLIPVLDCDQITLSPIVEVTQAGGRFLDIGVTETCNFFGGGILSHNSKQIPMTCDANPNRKDPGGISSIKFSAVEGHDMSEPAKWLAKKIAETMELGETGERGYDAFGVGLRSNAEAYTYGLELLKKGIPFRSKVNFFSDPNTKSLLNWLIIADEGIDGDTDRINDAVLNARSAPATTLGPKFVDTLTNIATGNYLRWLEQNWQSIYGTSEYGDYLKGYLDNLLMVAALKDQGLSNEQLMATLLQLVGFDGSTVEDALVDKIRDDDEAMAELRAASADGNVSEDDIKEQAFAPIAPLTGLLGARANLTEAMKFVRTLQSANAKLATEDDPDAVGFKEPAVTLGTMHSWKGLEVENMFIPMVGGRFPRTGSSEDELASERRLGYVALTRGENQVFVMNIPSIKMTKNGPIVLTSQFIGELCLPSVGKTGNVHVAEDTRPLPFGMSAHDPALLDAYLRGKDPYEVALSMGQDQDDNLIMAAFDQHGSDVISALREG